MTEPRINILAEGLIAGRACSFSLRSDARRIVLMGPTGTGKSSILKFVAGLSRHLQGDCQHRGVVLQSKALNIAASQRGFAWVPQESFLLPHLKVRDNILFAKPSAHDLALEWAEECGVEELMDRYPRHLSGGEKQRVALLRSLVSRPRLLLVDEGFASLDEKTSKDIKAFLKKQLDANDIDVIFATHNADDVKTFDAELWNVVASELQRG